MLFGRKGDIRHAIAFDCGTAAVRAALFSYEEKNIFTKPTVNEVIRFPFESISYSDSHFLKRKTLEGIRSVLDRIPYSYRPHEILIGLSSPFYISKTVSISRERSWPQKPITKEEFDGIVTEAKEAYCKEALKHVTSAELVPFTAIALRTYVNGYPVEQAAGTAGRILEFLVRFEATTSDVYHSVSELCTHRFAGSGIQMTSVTLANALALRMLYGSEESFLVIDIGGEVSDVALVTGGVLQHTVSFPLGHALLLREAAVLLGVSPADADFIVSRHKEHALDHAKEKLLGPLIVEFEDMWRKKLLNILASYGEHYELPLRILLVGGGVLPFHKELFAEDAFRNVLLRKNASVECIMPSLLDRHFSKQAFQGVSDFGLASVTLLAARSVL
ncbi:MAG: hypothetical protein G01um101470_1128 [Parcubacteria group bacterium Gr01-1014_70]|nr:MAG: hypothetical protein G01um101470_1128 [Parcubacteria group bacterium Gr01-1014_70]